MLNIFNKKEIKIEKSELDSLIEESLNVSSDNFFFKDKVIKYIAKNKSVELINIFLGKHIICINELIHQNIIDYNDFKIKNNVSFIQELAFGNDFGKFDIFFKVLKNGFFNPNNIFKIKNLDEEEYFENFVNYSITDQLYIDENNLIDNDKYSLNLSLNEQINLNIELKEYYQGGIFLEFKGNNKFKKIHLNDIYDINFDNSILYINKEEICLIDFHYINKELFFNILDSLSFLVTSNINNFKKDLINNNEKTLKTITKSLSNINNNINKQTNTIGGAAILGLTLCALN